MNCEKHGIEFCTDCAVEWIKSKEGQAAMKEAREQVNAAIENLLNPKHTVGRLMQPQCTCCPIHGRK